MRKNAKWTLMTALAFVGLFLMSGTANTARADDHDYIYCVLTDGIHSTVYFSNVFLGDYSRNLKYENAFTNFVHGHYSDVIGAASCFFKDSAGDARSEEDGTRSTDRGIYKQLIDTGWTY